MTAVNLHSHTKAVLRDKFAVFSTGRRMYTGVSFLKAQIYFFTIPKEVP